MNEEQMRTEFEAWWKQTLLIKHDLTVGEVNTYCKRSPDGYYIHAATAMRWDGWQAALDHALGEQWQPIDTVPVNESVLMLRMGKYGRCGMADGYKQENGVIAWPYVNKEPTHWMPLPSAPVNKLGG